MSDKPPFSEFGDWAKINLGFDIEDKAVQIWTKTNVEGARSQIQQHPIVALVEKFIAENQASSQRSTINVVGRDLQLHSKSYQSILSKLYRTNVLNNRKFAVPPRGGWIKPQNMFGKLNDLVRSKIVCRHINEPAMIAQEILKLAQGANLKASGRAQTKDEGYYAHHIYLTVPARIVDQQWQEFDESVRLEIQITTEMQNMLYELTHTFYDKERHVVPKDPHSWKWDYRSARFSASYLSHTLHLVEGMILQLYEDIEREKRAESLKNDNNSNVAEVDVAREAVAEQLDPKEPVELNQSEKLADIANLSSGAEAKP
jgi:ppGpp synthetase/RelA/SpoT-type nucleotidyltranferase